MPMLYYNKRYYQFMGEALSNFISLIMLQMIKALALIIKW